LSALSSHGEIVLPVGAISSHRQEVVMKEALWNVITDLKLMVLIIVVSQVIAIAKAIL